MWLIETGGKRPEFWASTMREIGLDLEVAEARQRNEEQTRRWHTWHAAALPNMGKKFPSFEDFIKPLNAAQHAAKPRQTVEQQIAIARQWTAVIDAAGRRKPQLASNSGKGS